MRATSAIDWYGRAGGAPAGQPPLKLRRPAGALAKAGAERGFRASASDGDGRAGPPPPRNGFGEVSPQPAPGTARAKADGAKPPGLL